MGLINYQKEKYKFFQLGEKVQKETGKVLQSPTPVCMNHSCLLYAKTRVWLHSHLALLGLLLPISLLNFTCKEGSLCSQSGIGEKSLLDPTYLPKSCPTRKTGKSKTKTEVRT